MNNLRKYTLAELAQLTGAEAVGDADYCIESLATLAQARPHQLSFLANPAYAKYLTECQAGIVVLRPDMADAFAGHKLVHRDPYGCYARITGLFAPAGAAPGIHPSAQVADGARLAEGVSVGAGAVIESGASVGAGAVIGAGSVVGQGAHIGARTRLAANVSLYAGVSVGEDCLLHSGAVIGADGFGFAPGADGWTKVHQLGSVRIGNKAEIGANTCIDRGALDDTIIGNDVKLDNLIQVGHNVIIGDHTAIASHTAIAGSVHIGSRCTIAGCVAITGHISIADGVHVSGGTVVTKSISEPGSSWSSGVPMLETRDWRRQAARFGQLDQIAKRVRALEKTAE